MPNLITILSELDFSKPDVIKENIRPFLNDPDAPRLFLRALDKACDEDWTELLSWLFFNPKDTTIDQRSWSDLIRFLGEKRLSLQGLSLSKKDGLVIGKGCLVFPQADFSKATLDDLVDSPSAAKYALKSGENIRFSLFPHDFLMSLLTDMLYQAADGTYGTGALDLVARSLRLAKEPGGYLSKLEQSYLEDSWRIARRLLDVLQHSVEVTPDAEAFLRHRLSQRNVSDIKKLYQGFCLRQNPWRAPVLRLTTPVMDYVDEKWQRSKESFGYKMSQMLYGVAMLGTMLFCVFSQEMPASFVLHLLLSLGMALSGVELEQFIDLTTSFIKMPVQLQVAAYLGGEFIERGLWGMEREFHPGYFGLALGVVLVDSVKAGVDAYYVNRERRFYNETGKPIGSTYLEGIFNDVDDLVLLYKEAETLEVGVSAGLKQVGQYVQYMALPYAATLATLGGLHQAGLFIIDWAALGNDIKLACSSLLLGYHGYRMHQAETTLVKTFQHYKTGHFGYEAALALLTVLSGPSVLKKQLLGSNTIAFDSALVTHPLFVTSVLGTFNGSFLWRFIFLSRTPADSKHVNIADATLSPLLTNGDEILGYATPYSLGQGLAAVPESRRIGDESSSGKAGLGSSQTFWRQVTFGYEECPADILQGTRDFLSEELSVVKPLASSSRFFAAQSTVSSDGVIFSEIPAENMDAASALSKNARALYDLATFGLRTLAVERR